MAKIILRAGKIAVAVVVLLAILGIILYGANVFSVAETSPEIAEITIPMEVQQMQEEAVAYKANKQYDLAQQSYYDIIAGYPGTRYAMDALAGIVKCQIAQEDFVQAEATVEKLLTDYSDHPDIVKVIGDVANKYRKDRHEDRAIEWYQYILSKYPSHSRAIWAQSDLARCYMNKKEDSKVEAAVEKLLSNYSDHPDIAECIGAVAGSYPKRKSDKAVELYQYVLSKYPSHEWSKQTRSNKSVIRAYSDLADVNCEKNPDKAIELYQYVLSDYFLDHQKMRNYKMHALSRLARIYIVKKDDSKADAAIDKLLANYSDHPDVVEYIVAIAKSYPEEKADRAVELHQYILSEHPSHNSAMGVQFRLIKNYMSQKDYINAQAAIDKLLTDYSDHPDIVKVIGNIADDCRKDNADIAIELYWYIVSEYPSHNLAMQAQSDLAKCYMLQNEDSNAQAAIDKLLADYSAHPDIVKAIGDIADDCRKENIDRAIELYQYITNMYPSDDLAIYAQSDLVECYIQKNDYAMALYCIDSATKDYPGHKQIAWFLKAKADCYFNMGAESQVEEVVDEILQSHLTNGGKHGALRGVAISYRESGNYEGSLDLCQRVLDNDPSEWNRLRAYTGIALSYIGLNDDPNVNETLDIICADFAGYDKLSRAIYLIGEDYYTQACKMKKEGLDEAAKESFLKANNVWKRVEVESLNKHLAAARIFFLGITSSYIGDPNTAIAYLQKVVSDYPTSGRVSSARYHIPQFARSLKREDPARAQEADELIETGLMDFMENHPDNVFFQASLRDLGIFYFQKSQYFQALDRFEQLVEMDNKELGKVVDRMSTCYEQLGSPETAQELRATYQQSLDM